MSEFEHLPEVEQPLIERWRHRYSHPEALRRWRESRPERAPRYAFVAVAQDGSVFNGMTTAHADKLAQDASRWAATVKAEIDQDFADSLHAAAAAAVDANISAWRDRQREIQRKQTQGIRSSDPTEREESISQDEGWQRARAMHPEFDEAAARMCLSLAATGGPMILSAMREPFGRVAALGALRYMAAHRRLQLYSTSADDSEIGEALGAVLSWNAETGIDPFDVDLEGGRKPSWELALDLARDAGTCRNVARRLLKTEVDLRRAASLFSTAEERMACVALTRRPELMRSANLDEELCRRLSQAILRTQDVAGPVLVEEATRWLQIWERTRPIWGPPPRIPR